MAADRMAEGRGRTDQILARDAARRYRIRSHGRSRQTALAHRARLSGAQAGAWVGALRGTRMARLPPSRHAVHRRLRLPDFRAGDDSPLVWGSWCQAQTINVAARHRKRDGGYVDQHESGGAGLGTIRGELAIWRR